MKIAKISRTKFEEARDFAGADWENIRPESRIRLLERSNLSKYYAQVRWGQLPPTVKQDLALTLFEKKYARKRA